MFAYVHGASFRQIGLSAKGLNLFHHKRCWFERQLSLRCHAEGEKVLILNKTYL